MAAEFYTDINEDCDLMSDVEAYAIIEEFEAENFELEAWDFLADEFYKEVA